jgi:5-methylcytosine-specific restriction endonuclease McrA
MITLAEYSLEEILPYIGLNKPTFILKNEHGVFRMKGSSTRYECFVRSQKCATCKVVGNIFLMQRHRDQDPPHLNLYMRHRNGELTLMTQDHKHPKSRGGRNTIDNLQTMCQPCNSAKGDMTHHEFLESISNLEKYSR